MKSVTGVKWTLRSLFVVMAVIAVHLAIYRVATPALAGLVGLGWSIAAVVVTRRLGVHPFLTALAAMAASTAAMSIISAAVVAQTAFSRTSRDTEMMFGGGWSSISMGGLIGGFLGLIMGTLVAIFCHAAFLPTWPADREILAAQNSLSGRESD
jgi:hypothetical protein